MTELLIQNIKGVTALRFRGGVKLIQNMEGEKQATGSERSTQDEAGNFFGGETRTPGGTRFISDGQRL